MVMERINLITAWTTSSKVAALANAFHLTAPTLLLIIGLVGCVAGFYAMYSLFCWIITWANQLFKERMPEQRKTEIVANLKRNWYFPISAMAFFCLNVSLTLGYFIGMLIAFMASLIEASRIPSMIDFVKQHRMGFQVVAILTALGICWSVQVSFYERWSASAKVQALQSMVSIPIDITGFVSVFGAVVASFFVYFCILTFWKAMMRVISENSVFDGVTIAEMIVYGILIIASLILIVTSFSQTDAFYGAECIYDIIYTSDSTALVKGNIYMALTNSGNDLRQPLFAVFAAPFIGIPYLFGKLFGASAPVQAMFVNTVQVVMLFAAHFMLSKMMKLNPVKRVCFMLLTSCTYTHLLFTLMMEQYIVAYFWLILCMFLISEKQRPDRIVLWGAGGTLLTSMILLLFMSEKNPRRNFKEWFTDMVKYGLEFVAVMLIFCRFDVIFYLPSHISYLCSFTGKTVSIAEKIYQYTEFIRNYFAAPDAGVNTTAVEHISWQMNTVTSINFIGIAVLLLVIVSTVLNRSKKSSLLAAGWVVFSVVMLLGVGWGTKENGLILYSLYFGWALLVLLFQLVEWVENKLNIKFLIPVLSVGCSVALAAINIPAIFDMVHFAITYFPA